MASDNSHRTQILIAVIGVVGVLGAAIIASWDKLTGGAGTLPPPQPAAQTANAPAATTPAATTPAAVPSVSIAGLWLDGQGGSAVFTERGDSYTFNAQGVSCYGLFKSSGTATVAGNRYASSYQSNGSSGSCTGTLSADGNRIDSGCSDSVCGSFSVTAYRR